nr:hypothetical protein Q903MT_gene2650 [Picea sitchensis]
MFVRAVISDGSDDYGLFPFLRAGLIIRERIIYHRQGWVHRGEFTSCSLNRTSNQASSINKASTLEPLFPFPPTSGKRFAPSVACLSLS